MAEAVGREPIQCEFESHRGHQRFDMKHLYPDDGGLKDPVRELKDVRPTVAEILVKHFEPPRNLPCGKHSKI